MFRHEARRMGILGGVIYNLRAAPCAGLIVVDRLSRRVLVGKFWHHRDHHGPRWPTLWTDVPAWALILLFAIFASVLSVASNLVYVYLPELFPTDLPASGIGLAVAESFTGSAASSVSAAHHRRLLWCPHVAGRVRRRARVGRTHLSALGAGDQGRSPRRPRRGLRAGAQAIQPRSSRTGSPWRRPRAPLRPGSADFPGPP